MIILADEGFTDDERIGVQNNLLLAPAARDELLGASAQEREELAFALLASLPRCRVANIQRRIAPLLQLDIVGLLPTEVALQILPHLSWQSLISCSMVNRKWRVLAIDPVLWRPLCQLKGWEWNVSHIRSREFELDQMSTLDDAEDSDDEGMGDEEDAHASLSLIPPQDDSGFLSMSIPLSNSDSLQSRTASLAPATYYDGSFPKPCVPSASSCRTQRKRKVHARHSAPAILPAVDPSSSARQYDYKLLFLTHVRLQNRVRDASYRLSFLQSRASLINTAALTIGHSNTIYCLQLYTYPETGKQVLFTGSKDRTIREWNLTQENGGERYGTVDRIIEGLHECSVLSLCVGHGYIASGSSDRRVGLWDLERGELCGALLDHEDSVLCVRFDETRLVSCSKDRTVRVYSFPSLEPQFLLQGHRAAVNAVSICDNLIASASGDRSMRIWDADTGALLRIFENHHSRGLASIDFKYPMVLSGSSDKHLRFFNIVSGQGWSTSPDLDSTPVSLTGLPSSPQSATRMCEACGTVRRRRENPHNDLVRSVAFGDEFVVSGSYDSTVKVWSRKTGALVADLTNGHSGRIFCVGFDHTKIVSCGEDQRICIWDFSHGIDTSFIKL
ncbi:WD40 repeat-like protein [Neolentinus lepideus HHB14362 ss-1]|uniref:WD40 repeat-like protein n=1 Tax=Neolentinus lepideus HHB14362 ss-1 TaxID=1314782 RepID=A0A165TXR5_9AGAM|nr:WD40 repeat-like protein [Neolentinus lepideus HHB14362 ss-1]